MKNLILIPIISSLFYIGCSNNPQVKKVSLKSATLLEKYGVSESALMKTDDGYIFVMPEANGIGIYKINKNYNLVYKKVKKLLVDIVKSKIINNKLYILGYDQTKNRPTLLIFDLNAKLLKQYYYGKKYDLAKDFTIINDKIYVALTHFSPTNNSDIIIYSNNTKIDFSTPNMDNVNFILPYKKGILIIGTTQNSSEDILLVYKTLDNKTVWANKLDLGMDEKPLSVKIKDNKIILKILSTDNMGAEGYYTFIIDEKGNIKSVKKGVTFKELPIRFRT